MWSDFTFQKNITFGNTSDQEYVLEKKIGNFQNKLFYEIEGKFFTIGSSEI